MIKLILADEPPEFDAIVRQPAYEECKKLNIALDAKKPRGVDLPPYWTRMSKQIHKIYKGVCAYQGMRFAYYSGASTTDHFIAKSKAKTVKLAYEWTNYRLSSLGANRVKNTRIVLDPCQIEDDWFFLNLTTGEISESKNVDKKLQRRIAQTITFLKLNDEELCEDRRVRWEQFLNREIAIKILENDYPIVYRQALLQKRIDTSRPPQFDPLTLHHYFN